MKTVESLLAEYGLSHQHPVNKRVHWVCVPAIVFSLLGFLWLLPVPLSTPPWVNWASAVIALAMFYYLVLTPKLALGMVVVVAVNVAAILALERTRLPLIYVYAVIFAAAWLGQFWGHRIEGARPSFFKDLQFLLIGPLWLLAFLYRRRGWSY